MIEEGRTLLKGVSILGGSWEETFARVRAHNRLDHHDNVGDPMKLGLYTQTLWRTEFHFFIC